MTTEQRLDRLEEVTIQLKEMSMQLKETSMQLTELMAEVVGLVHRQDERLQHQRELLDEVRQDTKMTRRLWVRLATKHGWLDDDDLNGDRV